MLVGWGSLSVIDFLDVCVHARCTVQYRHNIIYCTVHTVHTVGLVHSILLVVMPDAKKTHEYFKSLLLSSYLFGKKFLSIRVQYAKLKQNKWYALRYSLHTAQQLLVLLTALLWNKY